MSACCTVYVCYYAESEFAAKFSEIKKSPAEKKAPVQLPAAAQKTGRSGGPATSAVPQNRPAGNTTSPSWTNKHTAGLAKSPAAAASASAADAFGLQYENCSASHTNQPTTAGASSSAGKLPAQYVNSEARMEPTKKSPLGPSKFVRSSFQTTTTMPSAWSNASPHHAVNTAQVNHLAI